ncbi:acyltransferase-like protein [Rhizodiscina lignyota]|uniref:Acyltransferase-like protein n=1 Tax=Rhizodiscina lignyota TaxID=1504668 RepID=A0A9P4M6J8_9PEZI|nr:acyltransferase-like protein [Rhizodiscina lignyota]
MTLHTSSASVPYPPSDSDSLPNDISLEEKLSLLADKTDLVYEKDIESDSFYTLSSPTSTSPPLWLTAKTYFRSVPALSKATHIVRFFIALLPSFVQTRLSGEISKPARLLPTSHLDGMRGLAAFFVFICHLFYNCYTITVGFGQGEPGQNNNMLQLPIIRLLYSGPPMVAMFFVISGYALSLKPLKQARAQQWDALLNTLTSSTFRRGMRLFLPTTASTFLVVVMLRLEWYEGTREFASNKDFMRNVLEKHPKRFETLELQLHHWAWKVFSFVHVWGWENFGGSTPYDVHLWTIPVEFRSSLVLFLTLLGLARTKVWMRLTLLVGVMWFTIRGDRWEMVLFLAGMFLAELDLIRGPLTPSSPGATEATATLAPQSEKEIEAPPRVPKIVSHLMRYIWVALGILGLYFMSQPDSSFDSTPGWMWLSTFIPKWYTQRYRFYQCLGSVIFVWATNNSQILQRPFNHPFAQYLGKISYALYLVHGPVIHVVGYRVEEWCWSVTGRDTPMKYNLGFFLSTLVIVPVTVWIADLFWRGVDTPCVRFARWFEKRCCVLDT